MDVEMAYVQDSFLTNDILQEMMLLVEFYKGAPDLVRFQEPWDQEHTYLDKLKVTHAWGPFKPLLWEDASWGAKDLSIWGRGWGLRNSDILRCSVQKYSSQR